MNEASPAQGHAIRAVIMIHHRDPKAIGFGSNKYIPSRSRDFSACISSRITTVIQVGEERATKGTITDLMSHSQFHCTGRAYLDMHGLIFETSVCYWQNQPGCYLQDFRLILLSLDSRCRSVAGSRIDYTYLYTQCILIGGR